MPRHIRLCPSQRQRFAAVYGHERYEDAWDLPHRQVYLPFHPATQDFSAWHPVCNGRKHLCASVKRRPP